MSANLALKTIKKETYKMFKERLSDRLPKTIKSLACAVLLTLTSVTSVFADTEAELAPQANTTSDNHVSVVCPFKESIEYKPERVRCGMISVPENRDNPDSRTIRLTYAQIIASARLPDEDENDSSDEEEKLVPREDPVIYLTGGPGVNFESYVKRFLKHDLTKDSGFVYFKPTRHWRIR